MKPILQLPPEGPILNHLEFACELVDSADPRRIIGYEWEWDTIIQN